MRWLRVYKGFSWERIWRHVLYWSSWSVFYVLTNYFSSGEYEIWRWMAFELVVLPIKVGCSYTIAYVLLPSFLLRQRYAYFIISTILTATFFGFLLYLIYSKLVFPIFLEGYNYDGNFLHHFIFKGIELFYIASTVVGIKFFQNLLHIRRKNAELKQLKTEAELKYLKNQVQPHFLFNTLNNLYGMVLSQREDAAESIIKLSDLLSYMLYECEAPFVSLNQEIKNIENYVELELLRYTDRLDFQLRKDEIPPGLRIAPLILLPFVENAFKHGPSARQKTSHLSIRIRFVEKEVLEFCIENDYDFDSESPTGIKSGIGLENVRKRLEILYKDRHTLLIEKGTLYSVLLTMDLSKG